MEGYSRGGNERLRIPSDVGRVLVGKMLCFAKTLQQRFDLRITKLAKR